MTSQSSGRFDFSDSELEQARVDDERERTVHALTQKYSAELLEKILRSFGDNETTLAGLPPLTAALTFQGAALEHTRSRELTAENIRELTVSAVTSRTQHSPSELAPCFDRAIFVFGLRRGANHAISEWLRGHFDDAEVRYHNSAEIALFERNGELLTIDHDKYRKMPLDPRQRILIVGYENLDPAEFPLYHNGRIAHRSDVVVILRDFPNTAASIVRQAREDPSWAYRYRIRDLLELWKRYAGYLEKRSFGYNYITFNDWFSDEGERRKLSSVLGLEHSDSGLNSVSSYGRGSSFDGLQHDGKAQDMTVLNRWESVFADELFQFLLLADEETLGVNKRIFGNFPHDRSEILKRWSTGGPAR
ncbi:hypothetical protein [Streptomyces sclerotialus]|uniref:hypothetical protein n=1 Tax=Streptomyces sclerotialus TaxID=1957 RepID=UPI0004C786E0